MVQISKLTKNEINQTGFKNRSIAGLKKRIHQDEEFWD